MPRLVKLPEGISVRGRTRKGGTVWSMRYRAGGKSCERKLEATSRAAAYREAADLASEVLEQKLAAPKVAVTAGADPAALELIATIRRVATPARAIKPLEAYVEQRIRLALELRGPRQARTWGEARDEFHLSLAARDRRPATIVSSRNSIRHGGELFGEERPLAELSPAELRTLWSGIEARKVAASWSAATLSKVRRELLSFLGWARRAGMLSADVTSDTIGDAFEQVDQPRPEPNPLQPGEQIRALLGAAQRRDQETRGPALLPLVRTLLLTGARRDAVRLMKWSELNAACTLWELSGERTKTRRRRIVDLTVCPSLVAMLRERRLALGGGEWVFPGRRIGKPWSPAGLSKAVGKLEKWGAPRCDPQRLRDTAASALCNWPKIGPAAAAGRLGHSPPTAWSAYVLPASMAYQGETLEEVLGIADLVDELQDDAQASGVA